MTASAETTRAPELARLIDELTAQLQRGEPIDFSAVVNDHPQFADELRELLPTLAALGDLSKSPTGSFPLSDADGNPLDGTLGDFRLIREVGRGGMGIVYEAEQISLNRRVALKVLPLAATMDPRHLQRFRNEAQAAACLHHANIVPVHGVGCDRGVHYYAMQLIDGQTLAQVIAGRAGGVNPPVAKSVEEENRGVDTPRSPAMQTKRDKHHFRHIAELIAQTADALEYAHSMGVLHRDIKPGNLMLDHAGGLWITDFGLAKLASPGGNAGGELTLTGDLIGTLRYMSPEAALARHGLVDHRTDIYSLGATLYELLTLKPAVPGTDKQEILKAIAWEEPTPLRKLDKSIPAELETIALKCLAKNPAERYSSAKELADDLRHWLNDKPIVAKPPGWREKAVKWGRRHVVGITTTAAVLLLATAGMSVSVVLLAKKEKQVSEANLQAQSRLEQLTWGNNLLASIFERIDPRAEGNGGPNLREQLKARLLRASQQLNGDYVKDEFAVAQLQFMLGKSLLGLGEPGDAAVLLNKAAVTSEKLFGPDDPTTYASKVYLGNSYSDLGRYSEALALREESFKLSKAKLGPDHKDTLSCMNNLASSYAALGRHEDALVLFEESLNLMKSTLGPDHPDTLRTSNNFASTFTMLGRHAEALALHEETLKLLKAKFGPEHPETLMSRNNLANSLWNLGRHPEALTVRTETLELRRKKLGPDHPDTLSSMNNLAISYASLNRHPEALALHDESLKLQRAKLGTEHPNTLTSMNNLAISHADLGHHAEALALREEVFKLRKAKLGVDHPDTLRSMHNLAISYADLGRHEDALALREDTLKLMKTKLGPNHPDMLLNMRNLAFGYAALSRHDEALAMREETLKLTRAKLGPDHPDTLSSMNDLALSYTSLGRLHEALALNEETLKLRRAKLGPDHPDTLASQTNVAVVYRRLKRDSDALPLLEDSFRRKLTVLPANHQHLYVAASQLAGCYLTLQRGEGAVATVDLYVQNISGKEGVNPTWIASMLGIRNRHFGATKDSVGCRATAQMWEKFNYSDPNSLYVAGCCRALCAAIMRERKEPDAEEQADRAINWLQKAVAAGFKDLELMKRDKSMDALRENWAFQKLLAELEQKGESLKQ